jgi:hypothetical protein
MDASTSAVSSDLHTEQGQCKGVDTGWQRGSRPQRQRKGASDVVTSALLVQARALKHRRQCFTAHHAGPHMALFSALSLPPDPERWEQDGGCCANTFRQGA